MIRAYALAQGAGTQVLTFLPWVLINGGDPGPAPRAALMALAWILNIAVGEYVILRRMNGAGAGASGVHVFP